MGTPPQVSSTSPAGARTTTTSASLTALRSRVPAFSSIPGSSRPRRPARCRRRLTPAGTAAPAAGRIMVTGSVAAPPWRAAPTGARREPSGRGRAGSVASPPMTAGDSRSAPSDAPADRLLRRALSEAGLEVEVGPGRPEGRPGLRCHVLAFAASGAMALTGWPAEPAWPKGDLIGALSAAGCLVEELSAALGRRVAVEPGRALCARVGPAGASGGRRRRGRASAGGSCRLLRASDGWVALNLGRPDDVGLLPALTLGRVDPSPAARGGLCAAGQTAAGEAVWDGLALEAAAGPARRFAQGAWELGLPASVLGEATPAGAPWLVERVGTPGGRQRRRPRVVDFTAL